MLETIVTIAIVAAAGLLLFRRLCRTSRGEGGCSCGGGKCGRDAAVSGTGCCGGSCGDNDGRKTGN